MYVWGVWGVHGRAVRVRRLERAVRAKCVMRAKGVGRAGLTLNNLTLLPGTPGGWPGSSNSKQPAPHLYP